MHRLTILRPLVAASAMALLSFALLTGNTADAEPEIISVELQAPASLTVGDRFHYVIRLEATEGTQLSIPPGVLPLAFQITSTPDPQLQPLGDGRMEAVFTLEIAAFVPGQITVPPIEVSYQEPDGATGTVLTPPHQLTVTSVLTPGQEPALRDLKPQLEIGSPSNIGVYLRIMAAILAALALILLLVWRLSKRKPRTRAVEITPEMSAEDRARVHLENAANAFTANRDNIAYYSTIAVTIRNYLTERYGFPAFALTTTELGLEMSRRGIDRWQTRLVNGLLVQCDAAVYARYRPAAERADHDLTTAFEIVEMSRPKPESTEQTPRETAAVR